MGCCALPTAVNKTTIATIIDTANVRTIAAPFFYVNLVALINYGAALNKCQQDVGCFPSFSKSSLFPYTHKLFTHSCVRRDSNFCGFHLKLPTAICKSFVWILCSNCGQGESRHGADEFPSMISVIMHGLIASLIRIFTNGSLLPTSIRNVILRKKNAIQGDTL